jgi:hypothetical protein
MRGSVAPDKREKALPSVIEGSVTASVVSPAPDTDGLNDRQAAFVDAYCDNGGDGQAAALAAGYADSSAANMGTRNLLKPAIQSAIEQRVRAGRGSALLKATERLFRIMEDSEDDRAVVQAAVAVMDRYGMAVPKAPLIDARSVNVGAKEASGVLALIAERIAARSGE